MAHSIESAGFSPASGNARHTGPGEAAPAASSAVPAVPLRDGAIRISALVDLYMAHYAGRDTTRVQRLTWWVGQIGSVTLAEVSDDHVYAALETLSAGPAGYWAGVDAYGQPIFKAKRRPPSPATRNRYQAAISAVLTWAIKKRIAPKGWANPCRSVELLPENNQKVRFLDADERVRLLEACKASKWPRLYLLVLMALTTGARRAELLGLRWRDVDLDRREASITTTKNSDPRVLTLTPAVVEELRRFEGAPAARLFPSSRRADQAYAFEARWLQAVRAAKIKAFRFHDLRHSCASYLAQDGASLIQIADVLGHRQLQVTKRYAHLATSHKAELVDRVMGDIR